MGALFQVVARRYFRAALFYGVLGMFLGAAMLWFGNDNFQFLHGHMLLVGSLVFAAYGAGFRWIAARTAPAPPAGASGRLAAAQFWLANVGLPGMLAGSVLPVGLGLDRIGVLFGFLEALAAALFALLMGRALRAAESGRSS